MSFGGFTFQAIVRLGSWGCFCLATLLAAPAVARTKLPSCTLVVSPKDHADPSLRREIEQKILTQLKGYCRPTQARLLKTLIDELPPSATGIKKARASLQKARTHFLNIRLEPAQKMAERAKSLFILHHASLREHGSYNEISQALMFLGRVLMERNQIGAARREFKAAVAINPAHKIDPASVPPNVRRLYLEEKRKLARGPRGSITVKTSPPGAQLELNGKAKGLSPITLQNLLPGAYYLRVRQEGYLTWSGVVQVKPANLTKHEIYLEATKREILLSSNEEQTAKIVASIAKATKAKIVILANSAHVDDNIRIYRDGKGRDLHLRDLHRQRSLIAVQSKPLITPILVYPAKTPAPAPISVSAKKSPSIFTSWWFWTIVGTVTAAAIATPLLIDSENELHVTILRD